MALKHKAILAALASAVLLPGCATATHYGYDYPADYGHYDRFGTYYDNPVYIDPAYAAPSIGLGLGYSDYDRRYRHWDREARREHRREHRHEYRTEDPRARAAREYVERAQRGDFDETTPHPLSKHYSGG